MSVLVNKAICSFYFRFHCSLYCTFQLWLKCLLIDSYHYVRVPYHSHKIHKTSWRKMCVCVSYHIFSHQLGDYSLFYSYFFLLCFPNVWFISLSGNHVSFVFNILSKGGFTYIKSWFASYEKSFFNIILWFLLFFSEFVTSIGIFDYYLCSYLQIHFL